MSGSSQGPGQGKSVQGENDAQRGHSRRSPDRQSGRNDALRTQNAPSNGKDWYTQGSNGNTAVSSNSQPSNGSQNYNGQPQNLIPRGSDGTTPKNQFGGGNNWTYNNPTFPSGQQQPGNTQFPHPSLYPPIAPSPYWPYDVSTTLYNGLNFFDPSFGSPMFWLAQQQQPVNYPMPTPTASGTMRVDEQRSSAIQRTPDPAPYVAEVAHIPEPSQDYLLAASLPPFTLETPNTKLLILDLNGTLLYRPRHPEKDRNFDMRQSSQKPLLRPHLPEFINYIFRHFKIMFWSSATPRNVKAMIAATTTEEQRSQVIATWSRDTLGLSAEAYSQKVITQKDLNKIFQDKAVGKWNKGGWDVSNTILLDDSVIKASYQPYNHVCVPEFVVDKEDWGKVDQRGICGTDDTLWQVAGYLDTLRYQGHVARFIKENPFRVGDGWNGMCLGLA